MTVNTHQESLYPLDSQSLKEFEKKGTQGHAGIRQTGIANGVKVRRVMQITRDLADRSISELRILDLACGEGVYSIEAGTRGASVTGLDGRTERMNTGIRCAERAGMNTVQFQQEDVRKVTKASHGEYDVIFFMGILYHLDVPDLFGVVENLYDMCRQFVIIDTHIALAGVDTVQYRNQAFEGKRGREHQDNDSAKVRQSNLLQSLDNTFNFHFTRDSLVRFLNSIGFTTVMECHAPLEPFKARNRITLVAYKGARVTLSVYPWVNGKSEKDIEDELRSRENPKTRKLKQRIKVGVNSILRKYGYVLSAI